METSSTWNGSVKYPSGTEPSLSNKPSWLCNFGLLPPIYHRVVMATTASYGLDSQLIYQIFSSSGLSEKTLQHIWATVNHSHPGWLTPSELVVALALIGVAQHEQFDLRKREETILPHLTVQYLQYFATPPVPRVSVPIGLPRASTGSMLPVSSNIPAGSNNVYKDSKINSPNGLSKSHDDEWADFTSFQPSATPAPKLNNASHQLSNGINFDLPLNCLQSSEVNNSITVDDEFGDFQTSNGSRQTADPPTYQHPENTLIHGDTQSKSTRPNYNLSSDFQSYESPQQTIQHEWSRCLTQCMRVMDASLNSLTALSSESDRDEFNSTLEGHEFFLDLFEVYGIVQRVAKSASSHGLWNSELRSQTSQLRASFQNHAQWITSSELKSKFDSLLRVPLHDEFPILPVSSSNTPSSYCGLCLDNLIHDASSTVADSVVPWAGRQYHVSCANFWINRVQLSLPALVLP